MRRFFKYFMALATAGLLANTASAVLLSDLISSGGTVSVGDKIFGDFGWSSSDVNANTINVNVGTDGNGNYFIQFQGPIQAVGNTIDIGLQYTARTSSGAPLIAAIDQAFTLSAANNGGVVVIGETVRNGGFGGPAVAQSSVGFLIVGDLEDPPGEAAQGDQLVINPTLSKVWVTKDIFLQAADATSSVGATVIRQSFHQVPDGGSTLLLLGSALSGLALLRLRRSNP